MHTHRPTQAVRDLIASAPSESQLPWWEWTIPENRVVAGPRKLSMLGYDPADFEGAGYQAYTALLHPDDHDRGMTAMRDHLEGRAALYEIDYRIRRASGDYTWYMDRGIILERLPDGSPLLLRGIVLDLGPALRERMREEAVVNAVRGTLPASTGAPLSVCAECGYLRYGQNEWVPATEDLLTGHPGEVSHGLCTECIAILYPLIAGRVLARLQTEATDRL